MLGQSKRVSKAKFLGLRTDVEEAESLHRFSGLSLVLFHGSQSCEKQKQTTHTYSHPGQMLPSHRPLERTSPGKVRKKVSHVFAIFTPDMETICLNTLANILNITLFY